MSSQPLTEVHAKLGTVMGRNTPGLTVTEGPSGDLVVESVDMGANGKPRWFGAVQTKKNYVSYHLMPVYEDPSLLESISPRLRARMQGKSCFNFKIIDDALFTELGQLTAKCAVHFTT